MRRTEAAPAGVFSIRRRIFVVAVSLLACAAVALVVFLRDYAHRAADRAFDRLLAASALTIAGSVQTEDRSVTVELPLASFAMLPGSEHVFYTVRNAAGGLVTGYGDLDAGMAAAAAAEPVFEDGRYHGEPIRIATVGRLATATGAPGWITVRVAETRGAREQLAAEILNRSALPLVVIVLVSLGLLWFGIDRAFAPLAALEGELRRRRDDDLAPVATPVPREVLNLVEALNGFMLRLRAMLGTLNGLVADAAHQIRTPLASLRAQAELALEEGDAGRLHERVGRIHRNALHASHLINQLLHDATIAHRLGLRERAAVGIAELVNDTRRRISSAERQRLAIAIAPELRRARLRGDRVALREMLRNLVDNALRYAPAGAVDITVAPTGGGRVALCVADHGPGIPDDEKQAVLERFHRGSASAGTTGSGLGLAIVRSVVLAHGGALELADRPGGGLCVTVLLAPMAGLPGAAVLVGEVAGIADPAEGLAGAVPAGRVLRTLALPLLVALTAWGSLPGSAQAQGRPLPPDFVTRFPAPGGDGARTLTVAGPTDTPLFAELARGFQRARPDVAVVYREMGTTQLYEQAAAGRLPDVDVLVSTAVDLQVRLANDGFALPHASPYAARLPPWAVWRNEVFGFTFEPAVIVYNPRRFTPATAPHSRRELLALLEADPARWRGRIGTYDIAASSAGYLLGMQDELVSSDFWGLANAMGKAGVRLRPTSADILDDIEAGRLDLGYNVFGSYALAREAAGRPVGVVVPQDYVLVLARTALIARGSPHPELAHAFLDWLLSPAGQAVAASNAGFGAIVDGTRGPWTAASVLARSQGLVQPIALGPALLVGLDQQRHGRFVQNWLRLVTGKPAGNPAGAAGTTTGR